MDINKKKKGNPSVLDVNAENEKMSSIFRPLILEEIHHKEHELRSIIAVFRHADRTPK